MISLKSDIEIEKMRRAGRIVAIVLDALRNLVKPGCTTAELEKEADRLIEKEGAISAFKGYKGYPSSICTSVNEAVVHGMPGLYSLKEGDIISIDAGVKFQGYYGDSAITVAVGKVKPETAKLIKAAEQALYNAISKAVVSNRLYDISNAIQTHVEQNGFSVVRDYVGHGIGTMLHEDPGIPNFGLANTGPRLKAGMVLAIETMVNMGTYELRLLKDGWTAVTADGKPSAHFEHTIAVTESGPQILTKL